MSKILTPEEKRILRNAVRKAKLAVGMHVYTTKGCRMAGPSQGVITKFTVVGGVYENAVPAAIVHKDWKFWNDLSPKARNRIYLIKNLVPGKLGVGKLKKK